MVRKRSELGEFQVLFVGDFLFGILDLHLKGRGFRRDDRSVDITPHRSLPVHRFAGSVNASVGEEMAPIAVDYGGAAGGLVDAGHPNPFFDFEIDEIDILLGGGNQGSEFLKWKDLFSLDDSTRYAGN